VFRNEGKIMRGRQVLMETLKAHGVEKIFGNPGTTESPLIDSLVDYPDIEYIVALHEGVAVGAASHYAQASGKTGFVNVHVAPGLGNAIGMIYGALKANSPLVVTAGQQDTRARLHEPVLGHDLVAMAAPVVKWSVQVENADELGPILRRAFKIANQAPAGPVFVALPINMMEQETDVMATAPDGIFDATAPNAAGVADMAAILAGAEKPVIIAGDTVGRTGASDALVALAECVGAEIWHELLHMQASYPNQHASARGPLPGDSMGIAKALEGADAVLMVGGAFFEDVWFADGVYFPTTAKIMQIEESAETLAHKHAVDIGLIGSLPATLTALRHAVGKPSASAAARNEKLGQEKNAELAGQKSRAERSWDRRPASMPRVMQEIENARPPNSIIVDESITASIDLAKTLKVTGPGDYYGARGGGIGQGVAGALGVAVAHRDRPILAITGDGSAMYSIQALWTAAHHDLAIVFVVLRNREYRVLKHNLDAYRQRFDVPSNKPYSHMSLDGPDLGYVEMAAGMGLAGARVEDPDDLASAIKTAFASGKPYVLEVAIEGKR
jgi:benzoylformate decarboxylase